MRPASLPLRALAFLALLGVRALAAAEETQPTVITSDSLEARSTDTRTYSTFSGHVVVAGTNIKITCDRLEVISTRSGGKAEAIGTQSQFEHLEAIGQHALDTGELLAFVADENPLPRWPDPLSVSELPTLPRLPED